MGCCLSKCDNKSKNPEKSLHSTNLQPHTDKIHTATFNDRGPPPLDEEIVSVKEVLSETPRSQTTNIVADDLKTDAKPEAEIDGENATMDSRSLISKAEEVSEISQASQSLASESLSLSESFETKAFADGDEVASHGGDYGRRSARRDIVHDRAFRGQYKKKTLRSPAVRRPPIQSPENRNRAPSKINRAAAPSPKKRNLSAMPSPDRSSRSVVSSPGNRSGTVAQKAARQRSASPVGVRPVISAGKRGVSRRSKSPSPRVDDGESHVVLESGKKENIDVPVEAEGKRGSCEVENGDSKLTNDSLENPQVSLECFIFL